MSGGDRSAGVAVVSQIGRNKAMAVRNLPAASIFGRLDDYTSLGTAPAFHHCHTGKFTGVSRDDRRIPGAIVMGTPWMPAVGAKRAENNT